MNTHQSYGFDSVNTSGHDATTAVQLKEINGILSVVIRVRTYAKTKKRTYTEKHIGFKLDSFATIAAIVNQLLSEEEKK